MRTRRLLQFTVDDNTTGFWAKCWNSRRLFCAVVVNVSVNSKRRSLGDWCPPDQDFSDVPRWERPSSPWVRTRQWRWLRDDIIQSNLCHFPLHIMSQDLNHTNKKPHRSQLTDRDAVTRRANTTSCSTTDQRQERNWRSSDLLGRLFFYSVWGEPRPENSDGGGAGWDGEVEEEEEGGGPNEAGGC